MGWRVGLTGALVLSAGASFNLEGSREGSLAAFASAFTSPLRKTAPYRRPAYRLGDRAGRSPGSRVSVARRPSQLPSGRF